ncbi:MAG: hypothetical protein HOP15_17375 [Planctomycetes bacterium]|nr:hypothetical protein [Planctomycetota bacterium]
MPFVAFRAAAALSLFALPLWAWPQGTCLDEDPNVTDDPATFEHRWAGQVNDIFSLDGVEAWTAEDGGRIRHRTAAFSWKFQRTPFEVREELRSVTFVDSDLGWCVGQGGWVLGTTDGGDHWQALARIPLAAGGYDDLQEVEFPTRRDGWIAGLHGIYYTHDGGLCWEKALLYDHLGLLIDGTNPAFEVEPYSLEIVLDHPLAPSPLFGLATAEPGYVFSTQDGHTWRTAFFLPTSGLCGQIQTPCGANACDIGSEFEPWAVEISRNPGTALALIAGGYGVGCGVVLASDDFGTTWFQELHECQLPGALCPPPSGTLGPLDSPRTYYDVALFDGDNTAVACGYNGQHIRRLAGPAGQTYWVDESRFANAPHPDNAFVQGQDANGSIFPLYGAWADGGALGSGRAFVTGVGGQIRASSDGGDTWLPETDGTFNRVFDTTFTDDLTGYQVGQFYRIGRTTDGGLTWAPVVGLQVRTPAGLPKAGLGAIDSDDAGTIVAVGGVDPGAVLPHILRSSDGLSWDVIDGLGTEVTLPSGYVLAPLRDVKLTGNGVAWAVGDNGLVLRSLDSGQTWQGFLLPDTSVNLKGMAFALPKRGIVVGRVPVAGGTSARIYSVLGQFAVPIFSQLTIPAGCVTLVDAAAKASSIYAAGKIADPVLGDRGVLLTWNGSQFLELASAPLFLPCTEGASPTTGEGSILDSLAIAPETGDLWVGGDCGMIWQYRPALDAWTEHKSQSSAHVLSIDFPNDLDPGAVGYFSTFRQTEPHPVLVRTTGN